MRKFTLNLLLFCCLLTGFLALLLQLTPNPNPANQIYAAKHAFFTKNAAQFNTIALGSSRLELGINPQVIDLGMAACGLSTFNLASGGTRNPETYYLYESLLEAVQPNTLQYALVELQPLYDIDRSNLNSLRHSYWLNIEYLRFAIDYAWASDTSLTRKGKITAKYMYHAAGRLLLGHTTLFSEAGKKEQIGPALDGYKPTFGVAQGDPKELSENTSKIRAQFTTDVLPHALNIVHLNKLKALIARSNEHGVHLFLLIPPRQVAHYDELLAIQAQLPKQHVIEVANPEKYPDLYQHELSSDPWHLNSEGADRFSNYIVSQMQHLLQNQCQDERQP